MGSLCWSLDRRGQSQHMGLLLLLLLLLKGCLGQEPYYYQDHNFSYEVEDDSSGNQFGHSESSHAGDTAGTYHVLLPDGRLQTVDYTVNRYEGFQARVQYLLGAPGEAPGSVHPPVEDPSLGYPYGQATPSHAHQPDFYSPTPQQEYYRPNPQLQQFYI